MLGHHADAFLKSRWLVRESLRALRDRLRASAHLRACRRVPARGRGRACHIARRSARCPADAKARRPRRRWPPRCARPCVARPWWAAAESRFRPTTDRRLAAGAIYHRTAETAASETRRLDPSGRPAEPGRGPRSPGISRGWSRRFPSQPLFPPLTYGRQSIPRVSNGTGRKAPRRPAIAAPMRRRTKTSRSRELASRNGRPRENTAVDSSAIITASARAGPRELLRAAALEAQPGTPRRQRDGGGPLRRVGQ